MKKQIIAGITVAACVALCAAVWLRSAEVDDIAVEPEKSTVNAEIEARSEETPGILVSVDTLATEPEPVAESEPKETDITAEEKTQKPAPAQTAQSPKQASTSVKPHMGDVRVVNGEKQIYIDGFGWIKDEGGGSVGIPVDGEGDINKQVGGMGGDAPPDNNEPAPGTEKYIDGKLRVWVPGFGYIPHSGSNVGTVAEDMYENGHKIGIMGGTESAPSNSTPPPAEQPEPTGDVIYIELQPTPTKDSTPPPYKPNGEPMNP